MYYRFERVYLYTLSAILVPLFVLILFWIILNPSFIIELYNELEYIWLLLIFLIPFFYIVYHGLRVWIFRLTHPIAIELTGDSIIYHRYTGKVEIALEDIGEISISRIYGGNITSNFAPIIIPRECLNLILKYGTYQKYEKYGKLFLGTLNYGAPVKTKDKWKNEIYYIQIPLWGLEENPDLIYNEIKEQLGLEENTSISKLSMFLTSGSL